MDKTKQQQIQDYLARTQPVENTDTNSNTVISAKADETKEELKRREKEQKAIADAEKAQKEKDANIVEQAKLQASNVSDSLMQSTEKPRKFLESLPTPVGIGFLLAILLFFVFVSVPVNEQGDTRLKLMFLTLRGLTHINYGNTLPGLGNVSNQNTTQSNGIVPVIPVSTTTSVGGTQTISPPPQPTNIIPFVSDFNLNAFLGME